VPGLFQLGKQILPEIVIVISSHNHASTYQGRAIASKFSCTRYGHESIEQVGYGVIQLFYTAISSHNSTRTAIYDFDAIALHIKADWRAMIVLKDEPTNGIKTSEVPSKIGASEVSYYL
jgi:hypothetical protein